MNPNQPTPPSKEAIECARIFTPIVWETAKEKALLDANAKTIQLAIDKANAELLSLIAAKDEALKLGINAHNLLGHPCNKPDNCVVCQMEEALSLTPAEAERKMVPVEDVRTLVEIISNYSRLRLVENTATKKETDILLQSFLSKHGDKFTSPPAPPASHPAG